jgi:MtN3 and saliva related transmembrane protein
VPQALKLIRSRETGAISLAGTLAFTIGIGFWLAYGLALMDWPLITSNIVTKVRHSPIKGASSLRSDGQFAESAPFLS